MTAAFPETRKAAGEFVRSWRMLWAEIRRSIEIERQIRAQKLIHRALDLDPSAFDTVIEKITSQTISGLDSRGVLARIGWVHLTADELTWVAARAGVIDHEAISVRPRPDELTAEGLLALRAKLTAALACAS